jgi:chemotaxis signal transduction protein
MTSAPHVLGNTGTDAGTSALAERVLVARLGDERIALPVRMVAEIIDAPTVTPLPLTPRGVIGQCAWRGQWVPVLDPAHLLGVARRGGAGTVIVAHGAPRMFALWVDDVDDVRETSSLALRPVPAGTDKLGRLRGILQDNADLIAVVDASALSAAAEATLQSEVKE